MKDWIASQSPPPPTRLAARLAAALPATDQSGARNTPRVFIEAAAAILRRTITEPGDARNRAAALDLLAADALITYAVEAAADDCEGFVAQTDEMIARLSSVAVHSTESQ